MDTLKNIIILIVIQFNFFFQFLFNFGILAGRLINNRGPYLITTELNDLCLDDLNVSMVRSFSVYRYQTTQYTADISCIVILRTDTEYLIVFIY